MKEQRKEPLSGSYLPHSRSILQKKKKAGLVPDPQTLHITPIVHQVSWPFFFSWETEYPVGGRTGVSPLHTKNTKKPHGLLHSQSGPMKTKNGSQLTHPALPQDMPGFTQTLTCSLPVNIIHEDTVEWAQVIERPSKMSVYHIETS